MQTRTLLTLLSTALLTFLAVLPAWASSSSHEQAIEDTVAVMRELNSALAGITDEASAKAAEDEIEDIVRRGDAVAERLEALGPPSPEVEAELERKYREELEEAMAEGMKQARRIVRDAALREVIDLEGAMESLIPSRREDSGRKQSAPTRGRGETEGEPEHHLELGSDENVPDWVSRYPGVEIGGTYLSESGSRITGGFTFRTSDPADEVLSHFEKSLGEAGLERIRRTSTEAEGGDYSTLTTRGGGRTVRVMTKREADMTRVVVSYSAPVDSGS